MCMYRDQLYEVDERHACVLQDELYRMPSAIHGNEVSWVPHSYSQVLSNMVRDFQLFQLEQIEQVIYDELVKPGTAFVLPKTHFQADWDLFRIVMRNSRLQFAHNFRSQDWTLRVIKGYGLSSGLNEYHQLVPRRLKELMSSGLHQEWKKWELYRRDFHTFRSEDMDFMPLSFESSDVDVVFYLFWIAILVSGCSFVFEWLWSGVSWSVRGYFAYVLCVFLQDLDEV